MRGRILTFLFVGASLSDPAAAACLLEDYSVEAEFKRSDAVVVATVVSQRAVPALPDDRFLDGDVYTVRVESTLRGARRETFELFSENSSGRFPMEVGMTYLLFLSEDLDRWGASNCGNSGLVTQRKEALDVARRLSRAEKAAPGRAGRT